MSYAYQKKVMIVSPMSLFPMLQVTNKALNNMKVEESINEIQINIEKLGNHLNAYLTYHEKLGNSITTVVNQYNVTNKEFKKIDRDITNLLTSKNIHRLKLIFFLNSKPKQPHCLGIEIENVDKPMVEE